MVPLGGGPDPTGWHVDKGSASEFGRKSKVGHSCNVIAGALLENQDVLGFYIAMNYSCLSLRTLSPHKTVAYRANASLEQQPQFHCISSTCLL